MNRIQWSFQVFVQLICLISTQLYGANTYILVDKKNVIHKFIPFDRNTDYFVAHVFHEWETDTFEVFDRVKKPEGIAIDLGAWIGTTSIWLSKHFHHVVAVDADYVSIQCLRQNLAASECNNVTICDKPISNVREDVVFGPIGHELNESMSCIKKQPDRPTDYIAQSITFADLLSDYIYVNEDLKSRKIAFIKCDIEGGEENILEDLLQFAYYNKVKVFVSFHLDWWKSKTIQEFEPLFQFFHTSCPDKDLCSYIKNNAFTSILFEPIDDVWLDF